MTLINPNAYRLPTEGAPYVPEDDEDLYLDDGGDNEADLSTPEPITPEVSPASSDPADFQAKVDKITRAFIDRPGGPPESVSCPVPQPGDPQRKLLDALMKVDLQANPTGRPLATSAKPPFRLGPQASFADYALLPPDPKLPPLISADRDGNALYANSVQGAEYDNWDLQGPSPDQHTLRAQTPSGILFAGGRKFYRTGTGEDGAGEFHDLSTEPLTGYAAVKSMTPKQVYDLRRSGERNFLYNGGFLPSTDKIEQAVGYARADLGKQSPQQIGANLDNLQPHVQAAVQRYPNVPPDLLNALVVNESRGMTNAVSKTGALGPMQLTAANYYPVDKSGTLVGQAINPFDPAQAIDKGAALLSGLIKRYGGDKAGIEKALTAYNQGQGTVDDAILKNPDNWKKGLSDEGKKYAERVISVRDGSGVKVSGYFGTGR